MPSLRLRKIARDLSVNKMRSFLVILSISIGIFGISVVANSYSILMREMNVNYMNTTPASASLWTDSLDATEIQRIRDLPYIQDAEEREKIVGRIQIGENEWKDIWLFVINDFEDVRLDSFAPESGKEIPDKGEILLERKALSIAKAEIGQTVNIQIPDGSATSVKLVGAVHAPGLAPAWMEGFAYGYITPETLKYLGGKSEITELKILVAQDQMNPQHIRENAYMLKGYLEKEGIKTTHIEIPKPGKHPHYDQMATLLYLMEAFGFLALLLSGVLVANMISAILEQQTRQIGIMKAVGASSLQVIGLYEGMVLIFSLTALLFSIPVGIVAGRGYALFAAEILNFNIYSYHIPAYVFAFEIVLGILIPVLTAAYPIWKGSRVTVREAMNDYGIKQEKYTRNSEAAFPKLLSRLPRPFLLSLRNTFRKKGRLFFTMLVIALGGTGFIVAMNIYASMYNTVDVKINSFAYDIQLSFDQPQRTEEIEKTIAKIPGVAKVEAWGGASASRIYKDGTAGNSFNIIAPPSTTSLLTTPPLYEGRWLKPNDTNAIVINQRLLSKEPDIKVGDILTLKINEHETKWEVIGISQELIGQPSAYANSEFLSQIQKSEGFAKNAVISINDQNNSGLQSKVSELVEQGTAEKGMQISSLIKIEDYRVAIINHLLVIATFLIIMSMLVVLVGGLGLATTISMNTMERTKEIGIMRAMGISSHSLTVIIVTEGIIIGLLSWLISLLLSWPVSKFVSYNFGMIFFESPLDFAVSIPGFLIWLAIVVTFAALASLYPSLRASGMTVRDALSYE